MINLQSQLEKVLNELSILNAREEKMSNLEK